MNFNNPIPRAVQPLYNEGSALRPSRDSDTVGQAWKKNDAVNTQLQSIVQNVAKLQTDIGKLKKRQTGYLLPQSTENFYPFKLYQVNPGTITTLTVGTTFDQSGNPSEINIDPTQPTNFAAVPPTVNPNTDGWRIWLVRDGIIEIRPYYSLITSYYSGIYITPLTINNWAYQQDVFYGTDAQLPYDTTMEGSSTGSFFDPAGGTGIYPDNALYGGYLVIGGSIENELEIDPQAGFWIEITPDTSDSVYPLTRIKLIRFSQAAGSIYPPQVLPAWSGFLIPIAAITFPLESLDSPIVTQLTFNHVINRWPTPSTPASPYSGNPTVAEIVAPPTQANLYSTGTIGAMQFRGDWQADAFIQTQCFYPGDVVTFTTPNEGQEMQTDGGGTSVFGQATDIQTFLCVQLCFVPMGQDPTTQIDQFLLINRAIGYITPLP